MLSNAVVIPPLITNLSAVYLGNYEPWKLCFFSHSVYHVLKAKWLGEKQYLHTVPNNTTLLSTNNITIG